MLLSKAIEGFILDGLAGSYSPQTMRLYKMYLGMHLKYILDCQLDEITPDILSKYMSYLRNEYKLHRPDGNHAPLSPSALDNHWKCLRAFYRWCNRVMGLKRPDLQLP